jgi:hypothetical protein
LLGDPGTASPFIPTGGSDAGTALVARIATLQATLGTDLGVGGFAAAPALPSEALTGSELESLISDPAGPIGIETGQSEVTFRGDAEAGVALTLADRWDQGGRRGGFRAAAEGLIRFPSGVRPRTDRRLEGGYSRQLAGDILERVAPPSQPFPARSLLASVRLDPGDVTTLAVRPFFRVARTFALIGSLERWSKGEDAVEYRSEADAIPGVDASVLAQESDASATLVSIGVTYSNPGALRAGGTGLPVDAGWTYERILSASGGIVPDTHRIRARLRLYFGLW